MTTATLRLFFALWPDADVQAGLAEWGRILASSLGGRLARAETIHLTLAFIGDTPASRLDELQQIGDALSAARFEMQVDTVGCWQRNGIAWAAPNATPKPLFDLVKGLEERLRDSGFAIESRPYSPHITLLRRATCRSLGWQPETPLMWKARDFVLVRSELTSAGSSYVRIGTWPLD